MKKVKKEGAKKGFTLIALLVVIAIIAILAVVVVLTLNPAEMMRRARDSNRASDLGMIKTAISLYLADVATPSMGTPGTCYLEFSGATAPSSSLGVYEFATSTSETSTAPTAVPNDCSYWFTTDATVATVSSNRSTGASGWIPIDLNNISSGAPISEWPVDPSYSAGSAATGNDNAGHFYSYIPGPSNNSYKIAAKMESVMYSNGGSNDLESTDGGTDPNMYEQGTLSL